MLRLAVLLMIALGAAPALAQSMRCDITKPCETSNFSYKPGDTTIRVFGEVVFHLEGHPLRELYQTWDDDGEIVFVAFGTCHSGVKRFRDAFPSPTEDPGYRLRMARDNVEEHKGTLKAFPEVTGTAVEVARDIPGLAVVDMRWYETWLDQWFSMRSVGAGDRYMSRKMCAADDGISAMKVLGEHRIDMPVGQ